MTIETKVCEHCGQSAFVNLLTTFKGQEVCKDCLDKLTANLYNWDNDNLAIKLDIGCSYSDYETIYVPFLDNCNNISDIDIDTDTVQEAFSKLVKFWEAERWGYEGEVKNLELIDIREVHPNIDITNIVEDSEFWNFQIYKDLSYESELYDSPFDLNPNDMVFSSWFAIDCMKGTLYSKDFGYEYCEDCGRDVCVQNPSNGWHSQVHYHENGIECNKCYEERTLRDGINEDFDNNIPGQFYNYTDIEAAGWVKESDQAAGSGHSDYHNPDNAISHLRELIESGLKVLVNYDSMAIGGMGGYFSVYTK